MWPPVARGASAFMPKQRTQSPCTSWPEWDGQPLDWSALVARLVHPTKVLVIEAMRWIDRPLSASELEKVFGDAEELSLSSISYHVRTLGELGVLTRIKEEQVRGGWKRIYVLSDKVKARPAGR
jgi:DNA-binding transcriptional ArsR family regulator